MNHEKIIADIKSEIETAEMALVVAKDHAGSIPELEAEIERLSAALKHLTAPQTPAGRKRIGDGQRKRRAKAEQPIPGERSEA